MLRFLLIAIPMVLLFGGCTDLNKKPKDAVTADDFYKTEKELVAAVIPVYNSLGHFVWDPPMFCRKSPQTN